MRIRLTKVGFGLLMVLLAAGTGALVQACGAGDATFTLKAEPR